MKLKVNDKVVIITGKDKGQEGVILGINKESNKVIIQGANMVKKHKKAQGEELGGIIETERAIDASNVALIDPKSKKATRVKYEIKDGKKVRIAVKSGDEI